MKVLIVKRYRQFVLYSSIIYVLSYLKPSCGVQHQSKMESLSSMPVLAGYFVKNFCYIINRRDLLQESVGLILRVHNSKKNCCCFLIKVVSGIYIPLASEIKEAYRYLVRMRTRKTVPNPLLC